MTRLDKPALCPSCLAGNKLKSFYCVEGQPAHQNLTYDSPAQAVNCRRGDIELTLCRNCGLVFNARFNADLMQYGENYDNRQSASGYFRDYLRDLAQVLCTRYGIQGKRVVEVGCGNGEFLELLCRESGSRGTGFDPAYSGPQKTTNASFISGYLSQEYAPLPADALIFRHVIEHISCPNQFLSEILGYIAADDGCKIIVEEPDFNWIIERGAYWDIFHEHANYFTGQALVNLLEAVGLEVDDIFHTCKGQYMIAVATLRPGKIRQAGEFRLRKPVAPVIRRFRRNFRRKKAEVADVIRSIDGRAQFTVWGAAAKGTTFLNNLKPAILRRIPFVIDMNTEKQGRYCAGTGHKIVGPHMLETGNIRDIIIMNPNYLREISGLVARYSGSFNLISI